MNAERTSLQRVLVKLHLVQCLLHNFWVSVQGIQVGVHFLRNIAQAGCGMGVNILQLREGMDGQDKIMT